MPFQRDIQESIDPPLENKSEAAVKYCQIAKEALFFEIRQKWRATINNQKPDESRNIQNSTK